MQSDNVGWDLEAIQGQQTLRLEVKGLSASQAVVEVTPNEYKAMKDEQGRLSYRLCVVTSALDPVNRLLRILNYREDIDSWASDNNQQIRIKEMVAARVTVAPPA